MRYYETLYIVNPNLENEALDITMGEIGTQLEKTKSKLINHRVWGKKRLAYQIENQKYGSFILLQFEGGEQDQMNEFNTWMKLNNSILRHMTVALDDKPEVYEEKVKEEPVEKEAPKGASEETPESDLEDEVVVVETTSEETETQPDVTEEKSTEETETTKDVSDESSEEDTEEKEAE
jgi:small subunit ribosomal protein S6